MDKLITDKQNEEEIKSVLDRICYELSAPIQKECLNMVNQYTDEIISMFVAQYTPQQVCAALGLCNPAEEEPRVTNVIKPQGKVMLGLPILYFSGTILNFQTLPLKMTLFVCFASLL